MSEQCADVVVVGGGAAGALAAAAARRAGRKVLLVSRGGGATQQSSGAVDVAEHFGGLPLGPQRSAFSSGASWVDAAEHLAATRRFHPYARVYRALESLPAALTLLREVAAGVHLTPSARAGHNLVLASGMGTVKRCALAPAAAVAGDLAGESEARPRRVGVVHVPGLPVGDGRHLVATLRYEGLVGPGPESQAPAFHALEVPHFRRRRDALRSPRELALGVDASDGARALADALAAALRGGPAVDLVLVPPLLGLDATAEVLARVRERTGVPVAEWLSLPPSVPGERLQRALDAGLRDAGVELLEGEAQAAEVSGGAVRALVVQPAVGGPAVRVSAKAWVLCTGKYLAGGIRREERFLEPVLNLPVFLDGRQVTDGFIGHHVGERPEDPQPFLRAGLLTDGLLAPLDAEAQAPAFTNLLAAGSVLSGYDPTRERCGMGVAAVTGMLAGQRAAVLAA